MKDVITGPKPVQKPQPRIWLGDVSERTFQRIVKYGEGWLAWCPTLESFSAAVRKINSMVESAGRGVSSMNFAADFMACVKRSSSEACHEKLR